MTNLFWDYQALMYRTAYRITREHQSAEDLVQETCMSLIDHLDVVKRLDSNRLRSYIASVTRNLSINYVVKRKRRSRYSFLTDDPDVLNSKADDEEVDSGLIREAEIETLKTALQALNEKERLLLELKYGDEKSNAETAKIFAIKADSVRSYLTKARRHLQEKINEESKRTAGRQ